MPTHLPPSDNRHRSQASVREVLDAQVIRLKRGRLHQFGYEPLWNAYFDYYLSTKYFAKPLLQFEDVTFHLFLRKNLNDDDPNWRMPSIRYIKRQFGMGQDKIEKILERLDKAQLLTKVSGKGRGRKGADVANEYILSDPIREQEEFLFVAATGAFEQPLVGKWQQYLSDLSVEPVAETPVPVSGTAPAPIPDAPPVPVSGTAPVPIPGVPPVPETGDHKHTSNKHTSQQQTSETTVAAKIEESDNDPPTEKNDVVVALTSQGITPKVALRLATRYKRERIDEKIAFLEYLREHQPEKAKNPAGWLRVAIEEDFAQPDGFKTKTQLDAERQEKERKDAEIADALKRITAAEAAKEELRKRLQKARQEAWKQKYGTTETELALWSQVLAEMEIHTPSPTYAMFLANTVLLSLTEKRALIGVSNPFAIEWLDRQLSKQILRTLNIHHHMRLEAIDFINLSEDPTNEETAQADVANQPITL